MLSRILIAYTLLLLPFSVLAQQSSVVEDSLLLKIYLADGFSNSRVNVSINGKDVLADVVLNSNPNYGLTGQEIIIYSKKSKLCKKVMIQTSQGTYRLKSSDNMVLLIRSDLPDFEYKVKGDKKYLVIYKRSEEYFISTFTNTPGFD